MENGFEFELPRGYVDEKGTVHKRGVMRLATAADEILPLRDIRVQQNPSYLSILLLSRVVVRLGELTSISEKVIESLYTMDLAYLQDMYQRINNVEPPMMKVVCPDCGKIHEVPINFTREG